MPTEYITDDETSSIEPNPIILLEELNPSGYSLIERMRKRWWNFLSCLPTKHPDLLNTVSRIKTEISKLNPPPGFTGLRVTLGGDRHTH